MSQKSPYKFDENLVLSEHPYKWSTDFERSRKGKIWSFPSTKVFLKLSALAYKDHGSEPEMDSKASSSAKRLLKNLFDPFLRMFKNSQEKEKSEFSTLAEEIDIPEGFEFLVEARNNARANMYYGVAYINRQKRQIIVAHRGTTFTTFGPIITDFGSIVCNGETPQISSAMTFAHIVSKFAEKHDCQIFFTGHSLGAWLAQITCFSVKYLTRRVIVGSEGNQVETETFQTKPCNQWDKCHPYTVVFDSPGAYDFLLKMKNALFLWNDMPEQEVNVSTLPVEIFQFPPNLVNAVRRQIGTVFLVKLSDTKKELANYGFLNLKCHQMENGAEIFQNDLTEEERLLGRSQHWRVNTLRRDFD